MDNDAGNDEKLKIAGALRQFLLAAKTLRERVNGDPAKAQDRLRLRDWQASRLARSHANLLGSPRYGLAAKFFLSDLYGPQDFSGRDEEIERILPLLTSLLPAPALQTVALAVELDALTEDLDSAMVGELRRMGQINAIDEIDDGAYSAAYRAVGRRPERQRQIALIRETGEALEKLARKPLLTGALKLMRGPARLAGLGGLQEFLESGFDAFRKMGGATEFLDAIESREQRLLARLFGGAARPFEV